MRKTAKRKPKAEQNNQHTVIIGGKVKVEVKEALIRRERECGANLSSSVRFFVTRGLVEEGYLKEKAG
jgi:hypothetical protein